MKSSVIIFALAAIVVGCNDAGNDKANAPKTDSATTAAAKPAETPPPPPMDSATKMKKWMEYNTPGDMHKMLAATVGTWTVEVTAFEPDKPPMKSTGSCENKMLLGGRFLQSIHKGNMMGMPFEGIGMMGYDNARKIFISSWQDNMGTGAMFLEGQYDAATKTITLKGPWEDPIMGPMEIREVTKMIDDKHQQMEMYGTPKGGKEMKWMELAMTKK